MAAKVRQAFGKRVRQLRMEQNISLRKFALMVGIDKGFLVDIEYGRKSPTLDTIEKIADGLGVPLVSLFENLDDNDIENDTHTQMRSEACRVSYHVISL